MSRVITRHKTVEYMNDAPYLRFYFSSLQFGIIPFDLLNGCSEVQLNMSNSLLGLFVGCIFFRLSLLVVLPMLFGDNFSL